MTMPAPFDRWCETVRPEWTDYNAHMNLAYYVLIFDHATDAFYVEVGLGEGYRNRTNCSTFAVESHITYDREVRSGETVRVETLLLDYDEKRLHYFHRMFHAAKGYLAATTELMAVHVDLATRRVSAMPAPILDRLAAMKVAHATVPRPEQIGRVIGIRRKS